LAACPSHVHGASLPPPRTVSPCAQTADMSLTDALTGSGGDPAPEYDLIALPGGLVGAEHMRDCPRLVAALAAQRAARRWTAALCAAPAVVLATHGLLGDSTAATCHPNFVSQMPAPKACTGGGGADGPKGFVPDVRVVVDADARLVTSRGPGTAIEFALQCVAVLAGRAKAVEVAGPMVVHEGAIIL
jgi:4-methyl-5(b-hydroxyethyl)-thiazole monophosphate biosynthesis